MDHLHVADARHLLLINLEHVKSEALAQYELIARRRTRVVGPIDAEPVEAVPVREAECEQYRFESFWLLGIKLRQGRLHRRVHARVGR